MQDLAIDLKGFQCVITMTCFAIYHIYNKFELRMFVEGQIAGFFYLIGIISGLKAFESGPGGPISAIINSQVIY